MKTLQTAIATRKIWGDEGNAFGTWTQQKKRDLATRQHEKHV